MPKRKINPSIFERCLLTEVAPYETPLLFSNWGSYNYFRNLISQNVPPDLRNILENVKATIPMNYYYYKDATKRRLLSLVHPGASKKIIELYKQYEILILRLSQKSAYSIRYPHAVARYYVTKGGKSDKFKFQSVEQLDENQPFASSYFAYLHYSHLHKYFESEAFTEIEKNFQFQKHLDVSKCFSSIYTHSISWATRGKLESKKRKDSIKKDSSFDSLFDILMQNINYQETNGIVIGPELSRLFAEIILQEVDRRVELKMSKKGHEHETDYHCSRYIDDYYLFYNSHNLSEVFTTILSDELECFKLYLNITKMENKVRPFISNISIKKVAISDYVNELIDELKNSSKISPQREINKIRRILNTNQNENHAITNFFLSALLNRINVIRTLEKEYRANALKLFIDIAFYLIRIDTRVSAIYKLSSLIYAINKIIDRFYKHDRISILDKLYYEICETIKATIGNNASVELMNLLIAETSLGDAYRIEKELINDIITKCRKVNQDDDNNISNLNYFEITTLLYYVKDYPEYDKQKEQIIRDSFALIRGYSVLEYSEPAHLLLDLVSCPFLTKQQKCELVNRAFTTCGSNNLKNQAVNRFVNFVQKQSWYFNWTAPIDFRAMLKKKDYMLSY